MITNTTRVVIFNLKKTIICIYRNGATLLGRIWWRVNKNKLVKWKALVDTAGIKSADLKDKFLFYNLAAFQTA